MTTKRAYKPNRRTNPDKRNGKRPARGLPAHILVAGKLNATEHKAMRQAMQAAGITTQSLFVAYAVRAFSKAYGVDVPEADPRQTLLPIA